MGIADMEALQGPWLDKTNSNHMPIGTIQGDQILWNDNTLTEFILRSSGDISIFLDGAEFTAAFRVGPPSNLVWSDGATWVRDELQGTWCKDGQELLGVIKAGHMIWDEKFTHEPSVLDPVPVFPFSTVSLLIASEESRGIFDPGPPGRLTWDDGEVWIRTMV